MRIPLVVASCVVAAVVLAGCSARPEPTATPSPTPSATVYLPQTGSTPEARSVMTSTAERTAVSFNRDGLATLTGSTDVPAALEDPATWSRDELTAPYAAEIAASATANADLIARNLAIVDDDELAQLSVIIDHRDGTVSVTWGLGGY